MRAVLSEKEAVAKIVQTVERADAGFAPFALVLGSGFSFGLVPTVKEFVETALPLWVKCGLRKERLEKLHTQLTAEEKIAAGPDFWKRFVEENKEAKLALNVRGLPEDYGEAYRAAFDPRWSGAVGEPAQARRLQRAMIRLEDPRLNAAHFMLASILGAQPGTKRKSDLFKTEAAFSRLILTTNFDPFLQTALQAVNRLYLMTDMGVEDDILDDPTDAIHLVYVHGSVHRRSQVATTEEIEELKKRNARILARALKQHGVIVLGYSGWDDAIVQALAACDSFDYRLYWCGREADPFQSGNFGPGVSEVLRKTSALYVQIRDAGEFMAKLHGGLVSGLPRLLSNPIGQVRETLQAVDLSTLASLGRRDSGDTPALQTVSGGPAPEAFNERLESTIWRLKTAEEHFASPKASAAGVAQSLGMFEESIRLYSEALKDGTPTHEREADLLLGRSFSLAQVGRVEEALADWDQILKLAGALTDQRARALYNQGVVWLREGENDRAIANYTRLIDQLPGAPAELVASALLNRGVAWGQKNMPDNEIADYSWLIEQLSGTPVELLAKALVNRGVGWRQKGEDAKAIADYSRVIDQLPDAPVEQVANALLNRGFAWAQQGKAENEMADYTRIVEQLPDAPAEQVAKALVFRGVTWSQRGEDEKAIADYTRVIDQLPEAPAEQVAKALYNRGIAFEQRDETEKSIADYTRVIDHLPGAPLDEIASALVNRGVALGKTSDRVQATADFSRLIDQLPGAPVEQIAKALGGRGWNFYLSGDYEACLNDTQAALAKDPRLDFAAFNLGLALLALGRDPEALVAYRDAFQKFPDKVATLAAPDLEDARKSWLSAERAAAVLAVLTGAAGEAVAAAPGH